MALTQRQQRFFDAVDQAIANGGMVHRHQAIQHGGWFFPSDILTGGYMVAAQLYNKGLLERQDVGFRNSSYMYRKVAS